MTKNETDSEAGARGMWAAPEPPAPKDWRDHVLLIGPPGVGKTIWARIQSRLVPYRQWDTRLTDAEYLYRMAGLERPKLIDPEFRPFRAPHHSVSLAGMTGHVRRGWRVQPGELSLAHGGVLFIDEAAEFRFDVVEAIVGATRRGHVLATLEGLQMMKLPSEFRLIVASSPCPCGFRGHARETCRCSDKQVERYLARLSPFRQVCRELKPSEWQLAVTALAQEQARQREENNR